ncbi:DUF397 domain-containing protein [Cryptosporangium sp. NPDC051539]|uniref:DUF397 domain-containing protein n=1 Tax=Cryptosporangium sp. NPDC051539 TaxID=3363962 RepID=UPI0037A97848
MPDVDLSDAVWLRSSRSVEDEGPTVEVAFVGDQIAVRDSTEPEAVLLFTQGEWDAFLAGVNDGEFDLDEDGQLAN